MCIHFFLFWLYKENMLKVVTDLFCEDWEIGGDGEVGKGVFLQ